MDLKSIKVDSQAGSLILAWLLFAVSTLVFAGVFAFLLAMARTPGVQELLPGKDYLPVALVGHVDLSVVVWFLAFMGTLWVLSSTAFTEARPYSSLMGWLGFWAAASGAILVIAAALLALGKPIFSNYIPVLTHPVFYTALVLIGGGMGLTVMNTFLTILKGGRPEEVPAIAFGLTVAGAAVFIALLCFGIALRLLPGWNDASAGVYFERLFWGGGHILQFANTIGMVTAWILLARLSLRSADMQERLAKMAFGYYLLFMLPAPVIFLMTDIMGQTYKDSFTHLMQFGLGPSTAFFAIIIIKAVSSQREGNRLSGTSLPWREPAFSSLILSMTLFALGGGISLMIRGSNVKIPAHYHGVIGAVTIAFMGLTYYLVPLLGKEIRSVKAARCQPYIYGIGQILFVLGMFWAGSHGVPRKTYGSAQNLNSFGKVAGMALTGTGGLIAITGGAAFVLNVLPSLMGKRKK